MRALVIGSSGGIGQALINSLKLKNWDIVALSRREHGLDVTDEKSVAKHLGQLEGSLDLIFVATGALSSDGKGPEKMIKAIDADSMTAQFALNAIGPLLVLKHSVRLLPRDRRTVFAVLSARVGSIGDNNLGGWYSYRASKAALNQFMRTASIELARTHKQSICVSLHPGTVATRFTADYKDHAKVTPNEAAINLLSVIDGLSPDDTGQFFDWAGKNIPW